MKALLLGLFFIKSLASAATSSGFYIRGMLINDDGHRIGTPYAVCFNKSYDACLNILGEGLNPFTIKDSGEVIIHVNGEEMSLGRIKEGQTNRDVLDAGFWVDLDSAYSIKHWSIVKIATPSWTCSEWLWGGCTLRKMKTKTTNIEFIASDYKIKLLGIVKDDAASIMDSWVDIKEVSVHY